MGLGGNSVHRHKLLQIVLEGLEQIIQDLLDLASGSATSTSGEESKHLGPVTSAEGLNVLDHLLELALGCEQISLGLHESGLCVVDHQRSRFHSTQHSHHLFQLGDGRFHVALVCLKLLLVGGTQGNVSILGVLRRALLPCHLRFLNTVLSVQRSELVDLRLRLCDVHLSLLDGSLLLLPSGVAIALELGVDLALSVPLLLRLLLHLAQLFHDLLHRTASSRRATGRCSHQQGKAAHACVVLHASPGLKRSPDSGIQRPAEPPYHTPTT
mmetsp:Transcript_9812/g.20980  ORF Transcript_9812/g.20980 Transcript_9812/m.20980 type:complete len:269 (+) Transcript_9812:1412-2218(+)